jgi:hypothetical protein
MYKKNNSQKLNIFVRACQIVFDVRSMIYQNDVHRINFVKFLLSNNVSELEWVWQRYRLRFDETAKLVFFWKQFCDFLKEQVNFIKLRITIVEQKIKLLHQRNNQSIVQLIVYLEALEKQWFESISNSLRASNFLLVLHEYFRKKIVRKNVNVANRKIVKKTVRQIKMWVHLNSWHATSSLWTTLMLELDDEWFLLDDYIMSYIDDSQSLHMSDISLTC